MSALSLLLQLMMSAPALADAPAIRAQGYAIDVGQVALSAGAPLWGAQRLGVSLSTQGLSPEVQIGRSVPLVQGRAGCDVLLAAGVMVPWRAPAAVLTGTVGLRGSVAGDRLAWEGSALVPMALEVAPERDLRVPVRAETALGVRVGRVWVAPRASMGVSWVTGGRRTVDPEVGLRVSMNPG